VVEDKIHLFVQCDAFCKLEFGGRMVGIRFCGTQLFAETKGSILCFRRVL